MSRRDAIEFEDSLSRAAEGRPVEESMASLVEVAGLLQTLADPPPPPPHNLSPGRQQFLTEAGRLRSHKSTPRLLRLSATGVMRLGAVLAAVVLLFGLLFGAGQAVADSLPGEAAYEIKLALQEARLSLTSDAAARAELSLRLAEQRLDEVASLLEDGEDVDAETASRAQYHLERALATARRSNTQVASQSLQQVANAVQQRQRTMEALAGEQPASPVRQLIREMERVRQEAHTGNGDPDGDGTRKRIGTPALPPVAPELDREQVPPQPPAQQQHQEQEKKQNQQRSEPALQPSQEQYKGGESDLGKEQQVQPTNTPITPTPTVSPSPTPSPTKKQQGAGTQQAPTLTPAVEAPQDPEPPGAEAEPPGEPGDSDSPGKPDYPPQSPPEEPPGPGDSDPPGKQKP